MFRRIVTLLACLAAPVGLAAQGPNGAEAGRIVGHVFSTQTGDALASVQVFIVGTRIGTLTSPDGRFVLRDVPNGTHSVQTEMIGYGSKIISDVVVSDGDRAVVDISLDPQAIELEGLTISVEAERGNTAALLGERRRAAAVVDAIGQDQISRSPDGDAGAVLKRVPGVLGVPFPVARVFPAGRSRRAGLRQRWGGRPRSRLQRRFHHRFRLDRRIAQPLL